MAYMDTKQEIPSGEDGLQNKSPMKPVVSSTPATLRQRFAGRLGAILLATLPFASCSTNEPVVGNKQNKSKVTRLEKGAKDIPAIEADAPEISLPEFRKKTEAKIAALTKEIEPDILNAFHEERNQYKEKMAVLTKEYEEDYAHKDIDENYDKEKLRKRAMYGQNLLDNWQYKMHDIAPTQAVHDQLENLDGLLDTREALERGEAAASEGKFGGGGFF